MKNVFLAAIYICIAIGCAYKALVVDNAFFSAILVLTMCLMAVCAYTVFKRHVNDVLNNKELFDDYEDTNQSYH